MEVEILRESDGTKIYRIHGIIFFGSVLEFKDIFQYKDQAEVIRLDLKYAKVMDFSALEAIDSVAAKYVQVGKNFKVIRPGSNCRVLLKNAENITAINIDEKFIPSVL